MAFGKKSLPFLLALAIHGAALVGILWAGTHRREAVGVLSGLCSIRMPLVKEPPRPQPKQAEPLPVKDSGARPAPSAAKASSAPSAAERGAKAPARPDDRNAPPDYPEEARSRGVEGTAVVLARVGRDGGVIEVTLARSSGSVLLDRAAVGAVRRWRFRPASIGGLAVESLAEVPIVFRLDRKTAVSPDPR